MKNIIILVILYFLVSCTKDDTTSEIIKEDTTHEIIIKNCPNCDDTVTWNNQRKYGTWKIRNVGYDGRNGNTHLIHDCGWEILGYESGGYGNTYAVFSCDSGVTLRWRYGYFDEIVLQKGWNGATSEGIQIGDSLTKFLKIYPNFKVCTTYYDSTLYEYYDSTIYKYGPVTKAWFSDKNINVGTLTKLIIR